MGPRERGALAAPRRPAAGRDGGGHDPRPRHVLGGAARGRRQRGPAPRGRAGRGDGVRVARGRHHRAGHQLVAHKRDHARPRDRGARAGPLRAPAVLAWRGRGPSRRDRACARGVLARRGRGHGRRGRCRRGPARRCGLGPRPRPARAVGGRGPRRGRAGQPGRARARAARGHRRRARRPDARGGALRGRDGRLARHAALALRPPRARAVGHGGAGPRGAHARLRPAGHGRRRRHPAARSHDRDAPAGSGAVRLRPRRARAHRARPGGQDGALRRAFPRVRGARPAHVAHPSGQAGALVAAAPQGGAAAGGGARRARFPDTTGDGARVPAGRVRPGRAPRAHGGACGGHRAHGGGADEHPVALCRSAPVRLRGRAPVPGRPAARGAPGVAAVAGPGALGRALGLGRSGRAVGPAGGGPGGGPAAACGPRPPRPRRGGRGRPAARAGPARGGRGGRAAGGAGRTARVRSGRLRCRGSRLRAFPSRHPCRGLRPAGKAARREARLPGRDRRRGALGGRGGCGAPARGAGHGRAHLGSRGVPRGAGRGRRPGPARRPRRALRPHARPVRGGGGGNAPRHRAVGGAREPAPPGRSRQDRAGPVRLRGRPGARGCRGRGRGHGGRAHLGGGGGVPPPAVALAREGARRRARGACERLRALCAGSAGRGRGRGNARGGGRGCPGHLPVRGRVSAGSGLGGPRVPQPGARLSAVDARRARRRGRGGVGGGPPRGRRPAGGRGPAGAQGGKGCRGARARGVLPYGLTARARAGRCRAGGGGGRGAGREPVGGGGRRGGARQRLRAVLPPDSRCGAAPDGARARRRGVHRRGAAGAGVERARHERHVRPGTRGRGGGFGHASASRAEAPREQPALALPWRRSRRAAGRGRGARLRRGHRPCGRGALGPLVAARAVAGERYRARRGAGGVDPRPLRRARARRCPALRRVRRPGHPHAGAAVDGGCRRPSARHVRERPRPGAVRRPRDGGPAAHLCGRGRCARTPVR